jgi:hypothetical protein
VNSSVPYGTCSALRLTASLKSQVARDLRDLIEAGVSVDEARLYGASVSHQQNSPVRSTLRTVSFGRLSLVCTA